VADRNYSQNLPKASLIPEDVTEFITEGKEINNVKKDFEEEKKRPKRTIKTIGETRPNSKNLF